MKTDKLNILVVFTGAWGPGFDTFVRGEGRWCLNIAHMLSFYGHFVDIAADGQPPPSPHPNCHFINIRNIDHQKTYDLYIGERLVAYKGSPCFVPYRARSYIYAHWNIEPHIETGLPPNVFIACPYSHRLKLFKNSHNQVPEYVHVLPAPFCHKFSDPNVLARGIFFPGRHVRPGPSLHGRHCSVVLDKIREYLSDPSRELFCLVSEDLKSSSSACIDFSRPNSYFHNGVSYLKVKEYLSRSRVNFPVGGPSNIIDAAAAGVGTLAWEHGGYFTKTAKTYNFLLPIDATIDQIQDCMDRLMFDDEFYTHYVREIQSELSEHTYSSSYNFFQNFVSRIGLL